MYQILGKEEIIMERNMYKANRQMTNDEAVKIFEQGNHGILAVNGDDGYPYAVPVNYIYENGKIYIHSAKYGYKIDMIKADNKVCFTAIINAEVIQNKFTAAYQSIVATGKIHIVEDDVERRSILEKYIYKMSPDFIETGLKFVDAAIDKTELLCIDVEELKGKQNMGSSFDV